VRRQLGVAEGTLDSQQRGLLGAIQRDPGIDDSFRSVALA
jgi:hypothetical protein